MAEYWPQRTDRVVLISSTGNPLWENPRSCAAALNAFLAPAASVARYGAGAFTGGG